jgi:ABC-2 type transport system ATP-binding protein
VADANQVRRRIGVTGQCAGLDEFLTGARPLIDRLGLGDVAGRRVGGAVGRVPATHQSRRQRGGSPSALFLFLDEPTTGLDPTTRAALWEVVDELTASGATVVMTTQYLDEADRLADDIIVLDRGRIAAPGTPAELKQLVGGKVVTATIPATELD